MCRNMCGKVCGNVCVKVCGKVCGKACGKVDSGPGQQAPRKCRNTWKHQGCRIPSYANAHQMDMVSSTHQLSSQDCNLELPTLTHQHAALTIYPHVCAAYK